MPYRKEPRWARWTEEIIQITRYAALGISGAVAIFMSQTTGLVLTGWLTTVFSLVALGGVITRRYHFELAALYFLSSALCASAAIMFYNDYVTVAWLTFSLVPFIAERLLYLYLIALDARKKVESKNV